MHGWLFVIIRNRFKSSGICHKSLLSFPSTRLCNLPFPIAAIMLMVCSIILFILYTISAFYDGRPTSIIYTLCMELYHVLNRGVEKRDIVLDNRDRARFVHDLYEFNSHNPAGNAYRRFAMMDVGRPSWEPAHRSPNRLVDIHGWVLMKNHYHLLISPRTDKGLSRFIQKLNGGYAKYFNERYQRQGALFQGKTKRILVDTDGHFLHILHYIHLNPLDFFPDAKEWRSGSIRRSNDALEHIRTYRWSSFSDYCGRKNFPSILQKEFFDDIFKDYERTIVNYLREIDVGLPQEYTLE